MHGDYPKTGYVLNDFQLFYLNEAAEQDVSYHYHDFHKLLLFLGGNVSYLVEGRTYSLQPGDIVLVRAGEIHRPIVHDQLPYERLILYLAPEFLSPKRHDGYDLEQLFAGDEPQMAEPRRSERGDDTTANRGGGHTDSTTAGRGGRTDSVMTNRGGSLLRISEDCRPQLNFYAGLLRDALDPKAYGAALFQRSAVLSLLLWLIRIQKDGSLRFLEASVSNPLILQILAEINAHIDSPLSIDSLAQQFHVSRSWLMHLFKAETGCSILSYLTEKRLFLARRCIQNGMSVTDACVNCGFPNYTSFYKAFRERFGYSPKDARRT